MITDLVSLHPGKVETRDRKITSNLLNSYLLRLTKLYTRYVTMCMYNHIHTPSLKWVLVDKKDWQKLNLEKVGGSWKLNTMSLSWFPRTKLSLWFCSTSPLCPNLISVSWGCLFVVKVIF